MNFKNLQRINKQNRIIETLKSVYYDQNIEDSVDYDKLISLICIEYGAGHRYVKEIIKDLINLNRISLIDGKLYYVPDNDCKEVNDDD